MRNMKRMALMTFFFRIRIPHEFHTQYRLGTCGFLHIYCTIINTICGKNIMPKFLIHFVQDKSLSIRYNRNRETDNPDFKQERLHMTNLQDKNIRPTLEEIADYIQNPLFLQFCSQIKTLYSCPELIEYSCCSMEKGWNIKFKKSGRALCTIYPREGYFTAMVVIGPKEKDRVEAILPDCSSALQELYQQTREGNGQRWLMIDLEDDNELYQEVLQLIKIRRQGK